MNKMPEAECWQCEERDVEIARLRAENKELLALCKRLNACARYWIGPKNWRKYDLAKDVRAAIAYKEK